VARVKTDHLIELIAQDSSRTRSLRLVLLAAVACGFVIAAAAFFTFIGFRPDISQAVKSGRFLFKFVVTITLAVSAAVTALRLGRPGETFGRKGLVLAAAPALLAAAALVELFVVPDSQWAPRLIGHNARFCLTLIPLLAIGPLACLLFALRKGAPSNPGLAGAVAGLAASGIAATLYASHCNDDSPLFVITWYPIAILIVTAAGYLIGRRLLRW
jgi:hypothetical protein